MTAEEMKKACAAIARNWLSPKRVPSILDLRNEIADAIAAIPVDAGIPASEKPDPRDAQIAILRAALEPFARLSSRVREALAATEPKT